MPCIKEKESDNIRTKIDALHRNIGLAGWQARQAAQLNPIEALRYE